MSGAPKSGQSRADEQFAEGVEWANWAVGRWVAFPVEQTPRPLVMSGPRLRVEGGFRTGQAKVAFNGGRVEWAVSVPESVREALTREAALSSLRGDGQTLLVTAAERSEAEFKTDRGPRRLPAWRLEAEDCLGPIWILDPEVHDWRPSGDAGGLRPQLPSPHQDPGARITVGSDGRTVSLRWLGAAPEYERYPSAQAVESEHAVAFVARAQDTGWTGYRLAIGHWYDVPARLKEPLGSRVFTDLHGNAGQVHAPHYD